MGYSSSFFWYNSHIPIDLVHKINRVAQEKLICSSKLCARHNYINCVLSLLKTCSYIFDKSVNMFVFAAQHVLKRNAWLFHYMEYTEIQILKLSLDVYFAQGDKNQSLKIERFLKLNNASKVIQVFLNNLALLKKLKPI